MREEKKEGTNEDAKRMACMARGWSDHSDGLHVARQSFPIHEIANALGFLAFTIEGFDMPNMPNTKCEMLSLPCLGTVP